MRLLTYNIREGGVGRAEQIAEVIKAASPDVVALQEARDPAVVEQIAKLAGFKQWGSRVSHSTGFLSNIPVTAHAWRHPPRTRHALLEVALADGYPRLFVVHLRAWFSKWSERSRTRELRGLMDGIKEQLEKEHRAFAFHLFAGDFNALAPDEKRAVMSVNEATIAVVTFSIIRYRPTTSRMEVRMAMMTAQSLSSVQ